MSYYPIKCIQCLRPIREAERCVKLTKDEIRSDNFEGIRQSDDIQLNDRKSGANKFVLKEKHIEIQYKSLAQLRSESVITNEEVYPVTISPEYAVSDECRNTELVQAVEVKDLEIGEEKVSGIVRKFYCPHCHSQLIPQADVPGEPYGTQLRRKNSISYSFTHDVERRKFWTSAGLCSF